MLSEIVKEKRAWVERQKQRQPLQELTKNLSAGTFALSRALKAQSWNLIAECKLQSPAKGRLCSKYDVLQLAKIYEENGAAALSVHTDRHFSGRSEDVKAVRKLVKLPILRKDFIIDEYQIYESRYLGADAVLLIARLLSPQQLKNFMTVARGLGLDCLVEVHSREEIALLADVPVELLGINNRDLRTFCTDIRQTLELIKYCERFKLCISESGISSAAEAQHLKQAGLRGILVGEGLVKVENIAQQTRKLALKTMEDENDDR